MTTNIEPGWVGFLTIELRYSGVLPLKIPKGSGIAQVIFEVLSNTAEYKGKYQDQVNSPQKAILTKGN
jgi:dCTP deaminase